MTSLSDSVNIEASMCLAPRRQGGIIASDLVPSGSLVGIAVAVRAMTKPCICNREAIPMRSLRQPSILSGDKDRHRSAAMYLLFI